MSKAQALKGQSLPDISIQETGTMENLFLLSVENDLSVTDIPSLDNPVVIPEDADKNLKVVNTYKAQGLKPATALDGNGLEGIEIWAIERDFIVS
ncbi:MAG: hypothetical protein ACK5KN_16620 [Dysgonomonas sp.]|uniref:hypothetical protein n=1 Tax=Dysgonomonas sp. TaxID=1891233 RepID=UPI003A8C7C3B